MRQRILKRAAAVFLTAALVMGNAATSLAAGWVQDDLGWWYQRDDGSYPANTWWQDEDGMWYLFDENGYIYTGCYRLVDGVLYPFLSNGMWAGTAFTDIVPGSWKGDLYTNDWSGFSITAPEGAVFQNNLDYVMLAGNSVQEFNFLIPGSTGGYVEMYYQDIGSADDMTDQQYMSVVAFAMTNLGLEVSESGSANLNGKAYTKVSSNLSGALFMDCYFRKVGHYMENLLMVYGSGDKNAAAQIVASVR